MAEDIEFDSEKAFREASNQSLQSLKRERPREKPTRLPDFKVGEMDRRYSTLCSQPLGSTLCDLSNYDRLDSYGASTDVASVCFNPYRERG